MSDGECYDYGSLENELCPEEPQIDNKEALEETSRAFGIGGMIDILEKVVGLSEEQEKSIIKALSEILTDDQIGELYSEKEAC